MLSFATTAPAFITVLRCDQQPPFLRHPPTSTHIRFHTYTSTRSRSHRPDEQIIRPLAPVRSRQWLICRLPSRCLRSWLARRLAENHFVSSIIVWLSHHLPTGTTVNSYFYQTLMAVGILMYIYICLHNEKVTFYVQGRIWDWTQKFWHQVAFFQTCHLWFLYQCSPIIWLSHRAVSDRWGTCEIQPERR